MTGELRFLALVVIGAAVFALWVHSYELCAAFCAVGVMLICWAEILELRYEQDSYRRGFEAAERALIHPRKRAE